MFSSPSLLSSSHAVDFGTAATQRLRRRLEAHLSPMSSDPLFASFAKPSASTTPALPTPKKRQISPPPPAATESAKKARIAEEEAAASSAEPTKKFVDADEFETEAKTTVPGNVGLGGGEPEGLILSHQVSAVNRARCAVVLASLELGRWSIARTRIEKGKGLPLRTSAGERSLSSQAAQSDL